MTEQQGHINDPDTATPTDKEGRRPADKPAKKHLIKSTWLRRLLKFFACLLIFMLMLPVLVYVPLVQDLLKDAACHFASKATGMTVQVDKFRLKFPLDVRLDGVLVLTDKGDTMVQARSLLADVKLLPLLKLDAQINRVSLTEGKYIMQAEDSSMTLLLNAGYLAFEQGSTLNFKNSHIALHNPVLRDADIAVLMDVYKQKPDSVPSPNEWVIKANKMKLDNVRFYMTMLPTFKDLDLKIKRGALSDAVIDLKNSNIHASSLALDGSHACYVVPAEQYVATHPAPVDTISPSSTPYTIKVNNASLAFENAFYGIDDTKPQPGFDPSYIEAKDVALTLENFYNKLSTVRLPITSLRGKERSGLEITSASGLIEIDSLGIKLSGLDLTTPRSHINGNGFISYELASLNPGAPLRLKASGTLGWADIYAYMPALKRITGALPQSEPIEFDIDASGTLSSLDIPRLDIAIKRFMSLKASGTITNPTDFKRLTASIGLNGHLRDAGVVSRLFGDQLRAMGIKIPTFSIAGHIGITQQRYEADLKVKSSAGDAALAGKLALDAETYNANLKLQHFDVSAIMPSLGIGTVTGTLSARGAGFNPKGKRTHTDIQANVKTLFYNGHNIAPLSLDATLQRSLFDIDLDVSNPDLDLTLSAQGSIYGDDIRADVDADMRHVDLDKLGFTDFACNGTSRFSLSGSANMRTLYCDIEASLYNVDWNFNGSHYALPYAVDATFTNTAAQTDLILGSDGLDLSLHAAAPLKAIMSRIPKAIDLVMKQVDTRNLDMAAISYILPGFTLSLDMDDTGIISHFIADTDYKFKSLNLSLSNDSTISGALSLLEASNASLTLDTVLLTLSQRNKMLDYKLHIGNTEANLPTFANVNLSGYVGSNRLSAYLRQRDNQGKEGYRLGLTAALLDSTVNVHLTPLDATIAYKRWSVNDDNYIQVGPGSRIQADLTAYSGQSSIRLHTPERNDSLQALQVQIKDLHIEDFLNMYVSAPPVSGAINSDLTLVYRGKAITGSGTVGVKNLAYDKQSIGDLDFDIKGGMGFTGNSGGKIGMSYNGREVLIARGYMLTDSAAVARRSDNTPTAFDLELKQFPLSIANSFLSQEYMQLTGALTGHIKMTGPLTTPLLNGSLSCDSVGVRIPAAASTIYFDDDNTVQVTNNVLEFKQFNIYGTNRTPLVLDGTVDATTISDIGIDLALRGKNVALVDSKRSSKEIYGKLFIDLDASARGSLNRLDVNAALSVLPSTDIYYNMALASSSIQSSTTTDVVKFVQFSDSTLNVATDSVKAAPVMNMRINASLNIINGAKATVNLTAGGTDKVTLSPYGTLSYTQNYMGDMRLNGSLFLGTGFVRYGIPMIGEKTFNFDQGSYVNWSGDYMNPTLHIYTTDRVKANVQQEGMNSRLIYFDVGLSVLGTLSAPKVTFDLSTDDDLTVQNELLSMSPDQRSASAMHLLLYNTYTGPGVKADANLSNPLYSFLEGQLNSWAAKNIRGIDLSFGIDNYKQTIDGNKNNTTSYSYQVSKSLFDNRFKIIVGGNYSTDAQADENFAQNLISDISFEYSLKQSTNYNMYLRLFRHTGYESILEGEVTETGVGFVMRRKLSNLRSLFRFGRRKHKQPADSLPPDSLPDTESPALVPLTNDSTINDEAHSVK